MTEKRFLTQRGDVRLVGELSWERPESGYQFTLTLTAEGPGTLRRNVGHVARLIPAGYNTHPKVHGFIRHAFGNVPVTVLACGEHADVALIAWRAAGMVAAVWEDDQRQSWGVDKSGTGVVR